MPRRSPGQGSVYRRKSDNRWVASLDMGADYNGERRVWCTYHARRAEAFAALAEALVERDKGKLVVGARTTLADYLVEWLHTTEPTVEPKWFYDVSRYVNAVLVPRLGTIPLKKLAIPDIQRMISDLLRDGKSPHYIQKAHGVLRHALNDAIAWQQLTFNPAMHCKLPKIRKKELVLWSPEQLREFLAAVIDDDDSDLFIVAILSGARAGELLALTWADVDETRQTISIQKSVTRIPGQKRLEVKDAKTATSRRLVVLPVEGMDALHRQFARLVAWAAKPGWVGRQLVFPQRDGGLRTDEGARRKLQKAAATIGLPVLTFHQLRHLSASLSIALGAHPRAIQGRLGHSSIGITMDRYGHLMSGQDAALAVSLGELLHIPTVNALSAPDSLPRVVGAGEDSLLEAAESQRKTPSDLII